VSRLGVETKHIEVNFAVGDSVSIVGGYFGGFIGRVNQIDKEKGIVRVTVSMMGKDVPVELALEQVSELK
jgi:transcriptional antiterminator NusG